MFKTLKRLFFRPTFRELLDEEIYQGKVKALHAASEAEYWAAMREASFQRIARLQESRAGLQDGD